MYIYFYYGDSIYKMGTSIHVVSSVVYVYVKILEFLFFSNSWATLCPLKNSPVSTIITLLYSP